MDNNQMGNRIFQKRKEYGYTMEQLGSMLGVNKTAVNKWEKGITQNIKQSTIKKMADIFEVSPSWLLGYDESSTKNDIPEYVAGTIEIIDLYSRATLEQRQAVLNLLRSFVPEDNN